MKKILLVIILVALGWKAYGKYGEYSRQAEPVAEHAFDVQRDPADAPAIELKRAARSGFTCDGRTYCTQMTSCDEAKYFVQHCPNVKMDGDNDGIPCETQWCT
jgi:hypothetical protein